MNELKKQENSSSDDEEEALEDRLARIKNDLNFNYGNLDMVENQINHTQRVQESNTYKP